MASTGRDPELVRFQIAGVVCVVLIALFGVLLLPFFPWSLRSEVSSAGLLVAGLGAIGSGITRAARSSAADRRPWLLMSSAGVLALVGNAWSAITGADPVTSPSHVTDAAVALGLAIAIVGLLSFPTARLRGTELATMVLDGLIAGAALLVIFSVLVYSEVQSTTPGRLLSDDTLALVIPVLDVALATVALLLLLRSTRSQRSTLTLVAAGFLMYAVSDLTFAARVARGTFYFGSVLDLGWIAGYITISLAAWVPIDPPRRRGTPEGPGLSDAVGTAMVFTILIAAAVVQDLFGATGSLKGAQAASWVVLGVSVGARQVVLAVDNARLRRGLERRVAEQTADLRRFARQTELLLESVGDGIYGVDREGLITFVNPRAAEALGVTAAELDRRRPQDVLYAPEKSADPAGSAVERAIAGRISVTSTDEVYRRADGSSFPVESTVAPLLDEAEVTGAVVVFRDVTQRREVERLKDEFLGVVSHELRTPLTAIRVSLELIESGHLGTLAPRAGRLVTVARESSERLSRLISDLLDIERIQSGTAPMTVTSLDARELLLTAAGQLDEMVSSMGLTLEVGHAEGEVVADSDQVLQALTNLVGNASKFSDAGSLITLTAHRDGQHVRFAVEDQGRGIPADKLDSVFERFVQVDSSDAREKGGTGLGLTITKGIVARHAGEIWATSTLGVGTTVSFTLPAVGAGNEQHTSSTGESMGGESNGGTPGVDGPAVQEVLDITVRRGSGTGRTMLSAFDSALQAAGVGDFNLITLSSVIPGRSRIRVVDDVLPGDHGDVLFCVRSEAYAAHPGDIAWAGLGWCVDDTGAGLFVEHHGGSEESVVEQIELSLADMVARRPGDYGSPRFALSSARCVDVPACAVAVAAYRVSSWFEPAETRATAPRADVRARVQSPETEPEPVIATVPVERPVKVTLEQRIDVSTARRYYQLYRETFGPLETTAVARQILHEAEFLEEMVDPRVNKYLAWSEDDEVIGLSTLTRDLATVPWISPGFFAHRYPEHHARGAIYYMGFTLVSAEQQGARVFSTMLRRMTEQIGGEQAIVAWDMCMVNEEAGLAASGHALLAEMADVTVETIDRQTYWAGTFH